MAKKAAEIITNYGRNYPFFLMMDDNIHYFKGITLRNDPHPQFEKYNTAKHSARAQADKIQMKDVLKYFSRTKIYENHLTKFYIIGFLTGNKFSAFSEKLTNAYGRAHVSQCVLINVTTPVDYLTWAWAMEDIDFNLRTNDLSKVNLEDGVIVKFNRFMSSKCQKAFHDFFNQSHFQVYGEEEVDRERRSRSFKWC